MCLCRTSVQGQSGPLQATDERTVLLDVDKFYDMQYGHAVIEKNGRTALIDKTGKVVIDYDGPYYPSKKGFINGMLAVTDPVTKKSGFVNTDLRLVFPCQFDSPNLEFNEHGRCGIGPKTFDGYLVLFKDGTRRIAPTKAQVKGILTSPHPWQSKGYRFTDSHLSDASSIYGKGGRYWVIAKDFLMNDFARIVVEFKESKPAIPDAQNSPFAASRMAGYVNWTGQVVIQPHYIPSSPAIESESSRFSEGLVWLGVRSDDASVRWTLIDSTGTQVGSRTYAKEPSPFSNGFSYIMTEGACAIIDRKAAIIHEFKPGMFGRISAITTRELPVIKITSFVVGKDTYFVYDENFRKDVMDSWRHCSAICDDADMLPFSPTPGWSVNKKTTAYLVEVEHRWAASDLRPYAQRGGGSNRRVGYVDAEGKWIIPPIHSYLGIYDHPSALARTTINYGGSSGKETIEGFVNQCGYFPIAKKPKDKW